MGTNCHALLVHTNHTFRLSCKLEGLVYPTARIYHVEPRLGGHSNGGAFDAVHVVDNEKLAECGQDCAVKTSYSLE